MPLSATHRPQTAPLQTRRVRRRQAPWTWTASRFEHALLHLNAALRSVTLDRELAAGVDPETNAALAVRARRLTGPRGRKLVVDGLAGALSRASDGTPGFTAAVRPQARELRESSAVLSALEARLRASEPVTARGVALLRVLLTDAASPLYQPSAPGELASRLRAAAAALEP